MPWVSPEVCRGCGTCVEVCPIPGAVLVQERRAVLNPALCDACEACVKACPSGAMRPGREAHAPGDPQEKASNEVIVLETRAASPHTQPASGRAPVMPPSGSSMKSLVERTDWVQIAGSLLSVIGGAFLGTKGGGSGSGRRGGGGNGGGGGRRMRRRGQ
jgi:NAD-dependent dihydropyrimidine dehydrogenase PreA subunit